jgi:leader peptidase (prepilin peptidase)/N-methyltransferase
LDERSRRVLSDPNWNLLNEGAFRTAKFSVFAVFTYFGACLGSFLNVAAWCIPRGKAIGVRSSKCPQCDTEISRIDNLPIFSYLNLDAKCRACRQPIPVRYLTVELVMATIFGSLFLYELVTGCNNVPNLSVRHQGILWIILYPKWPAIATYVFHTFFMSTVVVLALLEWDKQRLKISILILVGLVFLVIAAACPSAQPIPLLKHLPVSSLSLPPLAEQILKLTVGGIVGCVIGRGLAFKFSPKNPSMLTSAFLLTGIVLGWQALAHVTIIFGIIMATIWISLKSSRLLRGQPTTVLLIAIMAHHPFWKVISTWW